MRWRRRVGYIAIAVYAMALTIASVVFALTRITPPEPEPPPEETFAPWEIAEGLLHETTLHGIDNYRPLEPEP